ncbi:MAG TPA: hypothetical protein VFH24_03755 [Gemmatimonadales bacterium]|nr:hypothetical protein [Gemmatimonadales bacterium]
MVQCFRIDRPVLLVYLGGIAAGCRSAPEPVVPEGIRPVSAADVAEWVASTIPPHHQLYRFKWLLRDERGSAGGRGSVRVAPPDSLRLDVAGPFGSGAASAVVVGDHPLWTDPPDAISRLVPNYPLMWAMVGIARMPPTGVELRGLTNGSTQAWQYAGSADTIEYARTTGDPGRLIAEVRQAGKLIGRVETTLASDETPLKARLTVPSAPAQLDLTFLSTARDSFAPDIWLPRRP